MEDLIVESSVSGTITRTVTPTNGYSPEQVAALLRGGAQFVDDTSDSGTVQTREGVTIATFVVLEDDIGNDAGSPMSITDYEGNEIEDDEDAEIEAWRQRSLAAQEQRKTEAQPAAPAESIVDWEDSVFPAPFKATVVVE